MSLDTNLHGRLRNTILTLNNGLVLLFEDVVNGIHAVEEGVHGQSCLMEVPLKSFCKRNIRTFKVFD
jgi:hypothetical protein